MKEDNTVVVFCSWQCINSENGNVIAYGSGSVPVEDYDPGTVGHALEAALIEKESLSRILVGPVKFHMTALNRL